MFGHSGLHSDDMPQGRLLSRKEALRILGMSGLLAAAGRAFATTDCVARPELTEGPFYVDEELNRADIRMDPSDGSIRPGATLALTFNVTSAASGGCAPLAGAVVDVWHCDAAGHYSDVSGMGNGNTKGKKFLRGYQVTDASGVAKFTTIYPGWYEGRAVHLHFKIRSAPGAAKAYEFTSQLFFDESISDKVYLKQPYASRTGKRQANNEDGIYRDGGSQLLIAPVSTNGGYAASFNIAMDTGRVA